MSGFFHSASCPPGPLLLSRVIECPSFSWLNISALYVHITLPGTWGRKQPTGGSLVRRCKGVLAADPHLAISHGGQPWPATEKTAGNQRQAQPALHLSSLSTTPHTRESQGRGRAAPVPLWMFLPSLPLQKKKTRVKKRKLRHSPQNGRNMIPTQICSKTINETTISLTEQVQRTMQEAGVCVHVRARVWSIRRCVAART